jgi:hypothetical protein
MNEDREDRSLRVVSPLPSQITFSMDNLPPLAEAGQMFEAKHGKDIIPEVRALFKKHEAERVFSDVLNHRHFKFEPE